MRKEQGTGERYRGWRVVAVIRRDGLWDSAR